MMNRRKAVLHHQADLIQKLMQALVALTELKNGVMQECHTNLV